MGHTAGICGEVPAICTQDGLVGDAFTLWLRVHRGQSVTTLDIRSCRGEAHFSPFQGSEGSEVNTRDVPT